MTEDDWIKELLSDKSILSKKDRLQRSCTRQFNEILNLPNKQLHDLSYKRLTEYICTRQEEYKTWLRTL